MSNGEQPSPPATASSGGLLIVCGLVLVILGILVRQGVSLSALWQRLRLGRLPGDFSWTSADGSFRVYFPLATSILISLLVMLILRLCRR